MAAQINNQELKRAFSDSTKTQMSEQPNQIDNSKVIPIIDVTPMTHKKANILLENNTTATGGATIYTTPITGDFYITSATFAIMKDAACDVGTGSVGVAIYSNGKQTRILTIPLITLTAQSVQLAQAYKYPLKCDRNTTIALLNNTITAGNFIRSITIQGYYEEGQ